MTRYLINPNLLPSSPQQQQQQHLIILPRRNPIIPHRQRICISLRNVIIIPLAIKLTQIRRITTIPRLRIQRTIRSQRIVILAHNIRHKEVDGVIGPVGRCGGLPVGVVRGAGGGALRGVEGSREDLAADIARAVGDEDGCWEGDGAGEGIAAGWRGVFDVA